MFFFFFSYRCSDDKVSPLDFDLISEDEKELKASQGRLGSRYPTWDPAEGGRVSCQRCLAPRAGVHPFPSPVGDHATELSPLSWGAAPCSGVRACVLETLAFQSNQS